MEVFKVDGQKCCYVQDVLDLMQSIIDGQKERCGEANAFVCWKKLQKSLSEIQKDTSGEEE